MLFALLTIEINIVTPRYGCIPERKWSIASSSEDDGGSANRVAAILRSSHDSCNVRDQWKVVFTGFLLESAVKWGGGAGRWIRNDFVRLRILHFKPWQLQRDGPVQSRLYWLPSEISCKIGRGSGKVDPEWFSPHPDPTLQSMTAATWKIRTMEEVGTNAKSSLLTSLLESAVK